jgi:hypothetical protein
MFRAKAAGRVWTPEREDDLLMNSSIYKKTNWLFGKSAGGAGDGA